MKKLSKLALGLTAGAALAAMLGQASAADVTWDRLVNAHKDPNNWLMYHQDFRSWHHSGLTQINTGNVQDLKITWMHSPGAGKRGIQSFPIVADGVLYYTSSLGQIYALDAATGAPQVEIHPED